ncbi:precorrin-3B synthase [Pseudotabrizicola sp. 4114]|uniref:precorrin-3B synthase n=1 Tax=Pseudotabrizicola sp. 4114 TaxID=2817731 RepID=UPI0028553411|nr:precorrin-3B synthase [Pseudorhodobacter sp. 4114]
MAGAGFVVQGWCPGALRPMMSGDGLVVRVRPDAGRLSKMQAAGIAAAAQAHGNGVIDLSGRGNVQLRGVTEASHPALIADLRALGLIDADAAQEAQRNLLVTPFADAATEALAQTLAAALGDMPILPGKFGFAIDTGPAPVLHSVSADIRLERDSAGGLILRCDGLPMGAPVSRANVGQHAVALAQWFIASGGVTDGRGRMAGLIARGVRPKGPLAGTVAPAPAASPPAPGLSPQGAMVGFEFGQMQAGTLAALAQLGDLRVTPWRMLLIRGLTRLPGLPGLVLSADDPLRRVAACTGAPGCLQAHAPVRPLARRLAPLIPDGKVLHVSGCAKGCAHPAVADVTLVATPRGFDRILHGTAQGTSDAQGLSAPDIDLKGLF